MTFRAERVKELDCPRCGRGLDAAEARPLSTIRCPHCSGKVRVPAKVGTMLVTRLLGQGTGSLVYEATDRVLNRRVALKIMKDRGETDLGSQSGVDEARALLLIDHPNIVKVYAIDTRRGPPCIIMEVLTGGSLKELLAEGRALDEKRALLFAIDVAEALKETSNRGLLHLDVKPGNIMFDAEGTTKLLDFGFAGVDIDDQPKEILGTPYYVSPELVRRENPDARSDMYSLGATLFHALTGRPPFDEGTVKELILARLSQPAQDVRELTPGVSERTARTVARMLERLPERRHHDYDELLRDLRTAHDPSYQPPDPVAEPVRYPRPRRRRIRTFPDAQQASRDWMRHMGFSDAASEIGYESGIDIQSEEGVGRVDIHRRPIGAAEVRRLAEAALEPKRRAFFFAMAGFASDALERAETERIALFKLDRRGQAEPMNQLARRLLERASRR